MAGPTTTITTSPRSTSNRRPARASRSATPSTVIPIYGYDEPDGSKAERLDAFNGHEDAEKHYHYHATKNYPYLNGGFHGEVTERGGQVDPQPLPSRCAQALPPLRGAKITEFGSPEARQLQPDLRDSRGKKNFVNYTLTPNGGVTFQFVDSAGRTTDRDLPATRRGPGPRLTRRAAVATGHRQGPRKGRRLRPREAVVRLRSSPHSTSTPTVTVGR